MPVFVLMIIVFVVFFVCGIIASSHDDESGVKTFVSILFVLTVIGSIGWMALAWSQGCMPDEYHYIESIQYPSGTIEYRVYPDNEKKGNVVSSDVPLTNDTIVKVWRYQSCNRGLDWMNDFPRFEIIHPTDGRYNGVKSQAQRRGIKVVDVEVKER